MLASFVPQSLAARLLAGLVLTLALFAAGYRLGQRHESNAREASLVNTLQVMAARAADLAQQDAALSAAQETARERVRIVYRTLRAEVNRYVAIDDYNDCGLDDDGLRLWNAANRGDAAVGAGESADALPGSARGGGRTDDDAAGQSPRRDGAVPPVPDPAQGSGAVGDPADAGRR